MLEKDTLVFDLETQKTFDEVGGREHLDRLLVSVAGVYSYQRNTFLTFTEKEIFRLLQLLEEASLIIGFNVKRFDYKVLEPYYHHRTLDHLPTLDILEEVVHRLGHRVRLQSLAQATLGRGKLGDGLDAIRFFRQGQMDKLRQYCLEDVTLTRDLFEFGKKHQKLYYYDRTGQIRLDLPVHW